MAASLLLSRHDWLSCVLLGTDFTCEVEPGHFYFIGREIAGPAFKRRTHLTTQVCIENGASTLRERYGVPTPMSYGCYLGFIKYMIEYGFPLADIQQTIFILKRSMTRIVRFPVYTYVVCRRKFPSLLLFFLVGLLRNISPFVYL